MAFNMPPGVSPRDIPGNRPEEDDGAEELESQIAEIIATLVPDVDGDLARAAIDAFVKTVGDAYAAGYADGAADCARAAKEIEA